MGRRDDHKKVEDAVPQSENASSTENTESGGASASGGSQGKKFFWDKEGQKIDSPPENCEPGNAGEGIDETEVSKPLVDWIAQQVGQEVEKLKAQAPGHKFGPLSVMNATISSQGKTRIHRVEFGTNFDFSKIKCIMVSEKSIPCPLKKGFDLVFVMLQCDDKPVVLVFGHLRQKGAKKDLRSWVLVN